MSLANWFKRLLAGPSEAAEKDADVHEEYGAADEGEADVERLAETAGGGPYVRGGGFATSEAAEAAEEELESEEAPPDPAP